MYKSVHDEKMQEKRSNDLHRPTFGFSGCWGGIMLFRFLHSRNRAPNLYSPMNITPFWRISVGRLYPRNNDKSNATANGMYGSVNGFLDIFLVFGFTSTAKMDIVVHVG